MNGEHLPIIVKLILRLREAGLFRPLTPDNSVDFRIHLIPRGHFRSDPPNLPFDATDGVMVVLLVALICTAGYLLYDLWHKMPKIHTVIDVGEVPDPPTGGQTYSQAGSSDGRFVETLPTEESMINTLSSLLNYWEQMCSQGHVFTRSAIEYALLNRGFQPDQLQAIIDTLELTRFFI